MKNLIKRYKVILLILICIVSTTVAMGIRAYSNNEDTKSRTKTEITQNGNQINKVNKGEEFEVTYTISPKDIPLSEATSMSKDIVFVVDTSANIKSNMNDGQNKLNVVKEEIKQFITSINTNNETRIGIVSYNKKAFNSLELTKVTENILSSIDGIIATSESGRNIGDGLRLAYYMLEDSNAQEKYVVLVNGENANYFSGQNKNKYYTENNEPKGYFKDEFNGNVSGSGYSIEIVEKLIKQSNINLLTLAVTENNKVYEDNNNLVNILIDRGSLSNYSYIGNTSNDINSSFLNITNMILTNCNKPDKKLNVGITVTETIPNTINIVGNKLNVKQGNNSSDVEYVIQSEGKDGKVLKIDSVYEYILTTGKYKAEDIIISFKAKGINKSKVSLGSGDIKLYTSSHKEEINLNPVEIEVYEYVVDDTRVTISVTDNAGKIEDIYDTEDSKSIEVIDGVIYAKHEMKNEFGDSYQLFGQATSEISFTSTNTDCLNYRVVNSFDIFTDVENGLDNLWDNWDGEILKDKGDKPITNNITINFPDEVGIYFILYDVRETLSSENTTGESQRITKRGIYGPFIRSDRVEGERVVKYYEDGRTELHYRIKPREIKFTDIYRSKEILAQIEAAEIKNEITYLTELDIINSKFVDVIPENMTVLSPVIIEGDNYNTDIVVKEDDRTLEGSIYTVVGEEKQNKFIYKLVKPSANLEEWKYVCNPVNMKMPIERGDGLEYDFIFEDNVGKLEYDDVLVVNANKEFIKRIHQILYFDGVVYETEGISEIKNQGVFNGKSIESFSVDGIEVAEGMNYYFGTIFEINSDNSILEIHLPNSVEVDMNNTFIYEVDEKGNITGDKIDLINYTTNKNSIITNKIDSVGVSLENGKQYAVVYSFKVNLFEDEDELKEIKSIVDIKSDSVYLKKAQLPDLF